MAPAGKRRIALRVLGLQDDATEAEIEDAFRELIKRHHQDGPQPDAEFLATLIAARNNLEAGSFRLPALSPNAALPALLKRQREDKAREIVEEKKGRIFARRIDPLRKWQRLSIIAAFAAGLIAILSSEPAVELSEAFFRGASPPVRSPAVDRVLPIMEASPFGETADDELSLLEEFLISRPSDFVLPGVYHLYMRYAQPAITPQTIQGVLEAHEGRVSEPEIERASQAFYELYSNVRTTILDIACAPTIPDNLDLSSSDVRAINSFQGELHPTLLEIARNQDYCVMMPILASYPILAREVRDYLWATQDHLINVRAAADQRSLIFATFLAASILTSLIAAYLEFQKHIIRDEIQSAKNMLDSIENCVALIELCVDEPYESMGTRAEFSDSLTLFFEDSKARIGDLRAGDRRALADVERLFKRSGTDASELAHLIIENGISGGYIYEERVAGNRSPVPRYRLATAEEVLASQAGHAETSVT